jgi:hypothetical protein
MNIVVIVCAILHCFYGFMLAQIDWVNSQEGFRVLRYAGWLLAWPVVLALIAAGRGAYFQD